MASRNFQALLWATVDLHNDQVNPASGRLFTDLEKLKKAADVFRSSNPNRDYRPVGFAEAAIIFSDYYTEKYGQTAERRMKADAARARAHVLGPHSVESYKYRPVRDDSGRLTVSGPESFDFLRVDDAARYIL
jgi:hypothetical protein